MTTASAPTFDRRLLRAPFRTRVFLGRQVVVKRLLASLLTAIVLGLAFLPFLLGAGMLLAFLSWGIGWILPCVFAAAGYLGYVRQDLPQPPKVTIDISAPLPQGRQSREHSGR